MSVSSPAKHEKDKTITSVTNSLTTKSRTRSNASGKVKHWIKKLPVFLGADYFRRKVFDSTLFDFTIKPLADTLSKWPRTLLIDNTNACNAKCVWCPNPDLTDTGVMKMPLFEKIIDDYATQGGYLTFGTFGEPLLDKTFCNKIAHAKKYSSIQNIGVLTNAYFLDEKTIHFLIENSIRVIISLDELEKKTFEEIKKMSYETVRENIIFLLKANNGSPNPVPITIRIKTLKSLEETLANEFFRIISDFNCDIDLTPIDENIISNWAGKFDKDGFFNKYVLNGKGTSKYNHKQFNLTNTAPCSQLWRWMVVYWDGSVVLCCADMFSSAVVGNLQQSSIKEVWTGSVLSKLRKKMTNGKRFEIPICKNCDIHSSWHQLKNYYDPHGNHRRFIDAP